jgi:hypothetical protein
MVLPCHLQAVWNADFCTVLPDVSVDNMNTLEREVCIGWPSGDM